MVGGRCGAVGASAGLATMPIVGDVIGGGPVTTQGRSCRAASKLLRLKAQGQTRRRSVMAWTPWRRDWLQADCRRLRFQLIARDAEFSSAAPRISSTLPLPGLQAPYMAVLSLDGACLVALGVAF